MKYRNIIKITQDFNGVFSRSNLPTKIKNGAYIINLDEYADVGTHWIALFCKKNGLVYFDSFGVEYICIGFIDFMLVGKKFNGSTNLFSPHDFKKTII